MRTAQAWCRKALWKARRTGSLPRKLKAMLDTPPLILQPGHSRLISRVALQGSRLSKPFTVVQRSLLWQSSL